MLHCWFCSEPKVQRCDDRKAKSQLYHWKDWTTCSSFLSFTFLFGTTQVHMLRCNKKNTSSEDTKWCKLCGSQYFPIFPPECSRIITWRLCPAKPWRTFIHFSLCKQPPSRTLVVTDIRHFSSRQEDTHQRICTSSRLKWTRVYAEIKTHS